LNEAMAMRRLVNGYQVSQVLHVAVVLGLPDLLAAGPRSVGDLAEATGCHARSLYRLLRALAGIGVCEELPDQTFRSTPLGDALRSDAAESVADWAGFIGREHHWKAWSALLYSVRTGESGFAAVFGQTVWEYRAAHPEEGASFDRAMGSVSTLFARAVLDAYDFGRFATVVDVGGGRGALLAAILARWPAIRGVLFDQAHVVAGAAPTPRCQVVAGDFFDSVPRGGDAYVLKAVLHDWDDARAGDILHRCRDAMADTATLVIVERLVGGPRQGPDTALSDLNMLVGPGGQERTEAEYQALLEAAGFRHAATVHTASEVAVVEAVPAR
jgi:hypothetical protein